MPSFELNRLQAVTGARALSDTDRMTQGLAGGAADKSRTALSETGAAKPAGGGVSLSIGSALPAEEISTAKPPIDSDRISLIRDALREGSYPLVPVKIADAIIAAQLSFEIER